MEKIVIAYVPVLHEGYRQFFDRNSEAGMIGIFGPELIKSFSPLAKDIRTLDPQVMAQAIRLVSPTAKIAVVEAEDLTSLPAGALIILPDEDVSKEVAQHYLAHHTTVFDQIFLRWDKHNSTAEKEVIPDRTITTDDFSRTVMATLEVEAHKSSDFWRHIAAAIVRNNSVVLMAHNHHVPSQHMPYVNGDPRNSFHKGINIELSTAIHAEAALIAESARRGIPLEGASLYVTVFPCPPCAKLIAYSGITALYCRGGYAVLDGQDILKSKDVKIVFVE